MSNYALVTVGIGCLLVGALLIVTYWAMFTIVLALIGAGVSGIEYRRHRGHPECRFGQLAAVVMVTNVGLFLLIAVMFGMR